eukprot:2403327-Karenia_brevis.AAC.1
MPHASNEELLSAVREVIGSAIREQTVRHLGWSSSGADESETPGKQSHVEAAEVPEGSKYLDCPGSHGLEPNYMDGPYTCSACEIEFEMRALFYSCRICDHDLCVPCYFDNVLDSCPTPPPGSSDEDEME